MKRCGLILLLLSGCVMVCHPQPYQLIRQFYYISTQMFWSDAQQYCRNNYDDLAIINSPANIVDAQKQVTGGEVWIGLFRNWMWSQTDQVLSSSFTNWDPNQPGTGDCVGISGSGSWTANPCSETHSFICYSSVTNSYILVDQRYTWSQAQSYCRNSYTDLTTISSLQDNNEAKNVQPLTWNSWIGLNRQDWVWSDLSKASNLPWAGGQPVDSSYCVTMDSSGQLHSHDCGENHTFLCYKSESILTVSAATDPPQADPFSADTKQSVKVRLTAGSADLNEPNVQESILQQVRQKLAQQGITEQVTLRWKTQADGKVFHKEEEEACPSYRDCGTD